MIPIRLLILALVATTILAGCGGPPAPTAAQTAVVQKQSALSDKLSKMSKEERAAYIKDHLAEVTAATMPTAQGLNNANAKSQ